MHIVKMIAQLPQKVKINYIGTYLKLYLHSADSL